MSFPGFSIPEGAWLPPELLEILPEIGTLSELKVTIAAIHETLHFGAEGTVISLSDFEALTGMTRKGVLRGVKAALKRGTMERRKAGNSYLYRLKFKSHTSPAGRVTTTPGSVTMTPADSVTMTPNSGTVTPNSGVVTPLVVMHDIDSTTESTQQDNTRAELVAEMRQLGVVLRVAQKLVDKYDVEYLQEKLKRARYAVETGLAQNGPGWFVASVKEDWQVPPLGYGDRGKPKPGSRENRRRYIEGKYADLIEH